MITGDKEREIKGYLMIDRLGEGRCWTEPFEGTETEGIKIVGMPIGYFGDNSPAFIEHRKNGVVIKTVNCADVSEIQFWIHIEPYDPIKEGHE